MVRTLLRKRARNRTRRKYCFVVAYLTPWSLGVTAVLFYTLTTLIDRDSSAETPSTNSFNEEIVLKRLKYFIDTSQISFGRELDDLC